MSNENTVNIFEQAAAKKLRFNTPKGQITVEQVFDLRLEAKTSNELDLDQLYISIATEMESQGISSPVRAANNPAKADNELRLAIVTHIINLKKNAAAEKQNRAAIKSELEQLEALQAEQQADALRKQTPEQVQARIAELRGKL